MAGDWIKMRHNLETDPDVLRIAEIIGVDRFSVVGRLHMIWSWADQHSVDGNAVSVTAALLDEMVCCNGFCDALRKVGWLDGRDWDLSFPNFDRHNGESAKKRAQTAKRVAKTRNASVTLGALPEKRREEKSKEPPKSPVGDSSDGDSPKKFDPRSVELPTALDTPDFRASWADWCAHRSELKKPLRPTMVSKQLAELADLGADRAVRAIEHTIARGWQGIREPDARSLTNFESPHRKPLQPRRPLP